MFTTINTVRCLVLLLLLMAPANAFGSSKYQDVFYPNGMPVKSSAYAEGTTEYELHDELPIPDTDLTVVVFSEKVPAPDIYSDNKYSVFISILQKMNGAINIKYVHEITDYLELTADPDGPGYFIGMNGIFNFIKIASDTNAVHLSMDNVVSGSGAISSGSDIFFLIRDKQLIPILKLIDDSYGGSAGISFLSFTHTFIYLADVDSDGVKDILTREYKYENNKNEDIFISDLSTDLNVYKYNSIEETYYLSGQITSMPINAVKLDQSTEPDVYALTAAGCCSDD